MLKSLPLHKLAFLAVIAIAMEFAVFTGALWLIAYLLEISITWEIATAMYLISRLLNNTFVAKPSKKD